MDSQTESKTAAHLAILDFFRGSCAFWVLAGHSATFSGCGDLPILRKDGAAVDIFMFVSGFLMTYHYRIREAREPWEAPATWLRFYIRRFFRIAPVYYAVLMVVAIWRSFFYHAFAESAKSLGIEINQIAQVTGTTVPYGWIDVIFHFSFIFGFLPKYCAWIYLPDWSIALEMQFYLIFPFLMLFARRLGLLTTTVFCLTLWWTSNRLFGVYVGGSAGLLGLFPQPSFLPLKLDCFLVGILVAEAYYLWQSKPAISRASGFLAVAAIYLMHPSSYFVAAVVMFGLVVIFETNDFVGRAVRFRSFRFLADMSFGVYLIHVPVLYALSLLLTRHGWYVHLQRYERFLLLLTIVATVSYALALLAHRAIELPGIEFGRRLIQRRATPSPTGLADGRPNQKASELIVKSDLHS